MECAVIINTAQRPQYLHRSLTALYRQTHRDFQVLVADDGSTQETLQVVQTHQDKAPFSVSHVWQPKAGHRRTEILNKAVGSTSAEYIIFTDCDSLVPSWFVQGHLRKAGLHKMLCGGRIKLTREQTESLSLAAIQSGAFESLATRRQRRKLFLNHFKNVVYLLIRKKRRPHNLGLNMSLYKSDLELVNGYDNLFQGWGNEDGDLRERLKKVGVWPRSICHEVFVFHQWHPKGKRNDANRLHASRRQSYWADDGLTQALETYRRKDQKAYASFTEQCGRGSH
ncbi:MAG: glycosyltransferase [Desulfohalobiaceae bacterium]|nr:glycosyltransferase [Desulfohalobiaceae bacterium]